MLSSDTSPDVNTSQILCLKQNTVALLCKAMSGMSHWSGCNPHDTNKWKLCDNNYAELYWNHFSMN